MAHRALQDTEYLCVSGGGIRGFCFLGAFLYIERHVNYHAFLRRLRGAVGTSVGTIIALCCVCNVLPKRMHDELLASGFTNVAGRFDFNLLYSELGLDNGDQLRSIIAVVIAMCGLAPEVTFGELYQLTTKRFVCCVTDLSNCECIYIDHSTHPRLPVRDGMYMSMTLPLVLRPMELDGNLIVDGCLTSAVPLDVFPVEKTFCLCIDGNTGMGDKRHSNFSKFVYSLIACNFTNQHRLTNYDACGFVLTIRFNEPQNTMSLAINESIVEHLSAIGYAHAFDKFQHVFAAIGALSVAVAQLTRRAPDTTSYTTCAESSSGSNSNSAPETGPS